GTLNVEDLTTGERVPYEDVPGTKRQILLFAKQVPAIGYKSYRIRKAETAGNFSPAPFPMKVSWDASGWITSIREGVRELAPIEKTKPIGRVLLSRDNEEWRADETGPGRVSVQEGPVTRRIEVSRTGSVLPFTGVTLYRDASYVDLRFDVDLAFARGSATGTNTRFAISLPFRSDKTFIDGAGFVIRVPEDILPGGKAPQFTPVQFVHYGQETGWGATVANIDAATLRPEGLFLVAAENFASATRDEGLVRLFRTEPRSSPVQTFRFRVAIQDESAAEWKRFGAEANVPLRAVTTTGTPESPQRGFVEVSDTRVHLLAFKQSELTPGLHVFRLQESSGEPVNGVQVKLSLDVLSAEAANLVEEPSGDAVDLHNLAFRPWETKTLLVKLATPAAGEN
ncbi:MAG: glycosyl hydrolase-related protein, partial [Bryobacteraceae bacterium]